MAILSPPLLLDELRAVEPDNPGASFTMTGYCVRSSSGSSYYVKTGSSMQEKEQYYGEAKSLEFICKAAPGLAPAVFRLGTLLCKDDEDDEEEEAEERPFMISEYRFLQPLRQSHALVLARRLALELHAYRSDQGFGFECATYCGATRTQGLFFDTWAACFADMISSLLSNLRNKTQYNEVVTLGDEIVLTVIPFLLGPPLQVEPVLLHGDLWSGNVGVDSNTNEPVIYDPASFFGHNEAELSIMRMFGGFDAGFFEEYHKHRPKAHPVSEYDKRQLLYELFHYLNHTCIFQSGGYAEQAKSRCRELLSFVKNHKGPRV